ncbi:hypothetical protein AVEN_56237-1 [Araneus ventricosus]|uniref:Uncharacterized protein n=1 Tax=Araneus ventricosus TaxID=182803 RepID=A0A4Y2JJN5_ARAVE|nr:hypothetical protein AVEN_38410-1 [Araneus ventricosus]GBM90160.1 hypothetical protein AVEN_56237-1 [Araneus ventricosus]
MVFFFHHYELPRFLHRAAFFNATRNALGNPALPRRNNHHGNDPPPPSNQDSTNEPSAPSDHPEASNDNQPNANESNQPDQQQPTDNLVSEGGVSAAGYDHLAESAVDTESRNSDINCCDDCHSFQIKSGIDSGVHTCLKKNPTASVSTAEGSSLGPDDKNVDCHQKGGNEVQSSDNFIRHQTSELNNNEFSDGRNAEDFVVEGIFKDREVLLDKSEKCNLNVGQKVEKQENVHSGNENDLLSRELSVD